MSFEGDVSYIWPSKVKEMSRESLYSSILFSVVWTNIIPSSRVIYMFCAVLEYGQF